MQQLTDDPGIDVIQLAERIVHSVWQPIDMSDVPDARGIDDEDEDDDDNEEAYCFCGGGKNKSPGNNVISIIQYDLLIAC